MAGAFVEAENAAVHIFDGAGQAHRGVRFHLTEVQYGIRLRGRGAQFEAFDGFAAGKPDRDAAGKVAFRNVIARCRRGDTGGFRNFGRRVDRTRRVPVEKFAETLLPQKAGGRGKHGGMGGDGLGRFRLAQEVGFQQDAFVPAEKSADAPEKADAFADSGIYIFIVVVVARDDGHLALLRLVHLNAPLYR